MAGEFIPDIDEKPMPVLYSIYSNDGKTLLSDSGEIGVLIVMEGDTIVVQEDGLYDQSQNAYIYQHDGKLAGIARTANATKPDYVVGDTFLASTDDFIFYIVEKVNVQIPITQNGTVTLATAGKYCDRNIEINVNTPDRYEEGKQAEYDGFWDALQVDGTKRNYTYTFAGNGWNDDTFNPKYPIIATTAQYTFYYCSNITSTKVPITIDAATAPYFFGACRNLVTIPSLEVPETLVYDKMFTNCTALQNITFTENSVIGQSGLSFSASTLLTKASVESIIHALSSTASGKSITLAAEVKTNNFTDDEWDALVATKSNWTIALA